MKKKICIFGAPAVGKTSLTTRFVEGFFPDTYLTTIGVNIKSKIISMDKTDVMLMVWDVAGEEKFHDFLVDYATGCSGYIVVVDGTRPSTVLQAYDIFSKISGYLPNIPFLVLINKSDLHEYKAVKSTEVSATFNTKHIFETSAKSGENVETAFHTLTKQMV